MEKRMSELPPLPEPQIVGPDGIGFSYAQVREVQAIARQQGRDEMREWKASRVRDEALREAADRCAAQSKRWKDERAIYVATECAAAIRSLIGTPKSAEGEGA
jgi:hypothetical protein